MSTLVYTVSEIASILNGDFYQNAIDDVIHIIHIDSRKVYSSANSIFFALVGDRHNGHQYIDLLIEKGVKNFIVSDDKVINSKANFILVNDTTSALQNLAVHHRNNFDIPVIGITGSNGKTIVKEWIYQLLKESYNITRSPKSYNSQVGVPLSVWLLNNTTELGIFEAGISTTEEMKNLQPIIEPSIGIFTNIGSAHNDGFKSQKEKTKEKATLFKNTNKIIYCKDYDSIDTVLEEEYNTEKLIKWSMLDKTAYIYAEINNSSLHETKIELTIENELYEYIIPYKDKASIENSINCIVTCFVLGNLTPLLLNKTKKLTPIAMRLEIKEGINNCTIINDTYNSDINSLKVALDLIEQQQQHKAKTLILSDIAESNKSTIDLYSEVANLMNSYSLYKFIAIGENISKHISLFKAEKIHSYLTTEEFINDLNYEHFKDESILIKGARDFYFEQISKKLELKVHDTCMEIDLNALINNYNYYKSLLHKNTKIMAMVKAFSYGSGGVEIANILQYHHIDYLAVAYADEGIELRKSGITLPIMVMNPDVNSFDQIIKYQLEPEIYSFSILGKFIDILDKSIDSYLLPFPIHIKVDTGMHRLGFEPSEVNQLGYVLKNCSSTVKVSSVFSHLAASSNPEEKEFTNKQISIFSNFTNTLQQNLDYNFLKHILNSGGIEYYPNAQFDMVRLGIGLYGISSNESTKKNLHPVSSLKSTISQIKLINKGETIGYNRKGIAESPIRIAIIAIGYADGINRNLGNGNYYFIINGQKAYTIGDICMDMCMVEVTDINCQQGDEITIFDTTHPIENMSKKLGTIPYEILTGISRRVKRVYFQE